MARQIVETRYGVGREPRLGTLRLPGGVSTQREGRDVLDSTNNGKKTQHYLVPVRVGWRTYDVYLRSRYEGTFVEPLIGANLNPDGQEAILQPVRVTRRTGILRAARAAVEQLVPVFSHQYDREVPVFERDKDFPARSINEM